MATLTFYQPADMRDPQNFFGQLELPVSWTLPTSIRIGNTTDKITYFGSFAYDSSGDLSSGNIVRIARDSYWTQYNTNEMKFESADRYYLAENLNIPALDLASLLNLGDVRGAVDLLASGNDVIFGSKYDDILRGGAGNDSIYGGEGDDLIFGDGGNNLINGGTGYDYAGYAANKSTIIGVAQTASGDVKVRTAFGTDTLIDIEAVVFSDGVLAINELVIQYQPPPFQTGAGIVQATIYDGPVEFLDFILIDDTQNAIVTGTNYNDFIKLSNNNSAGKAVDGGGGDDVIDGGVGSTFISGGGGSNTIFLDGRALGVSWSTITDFAIGVDKATIWGWKQGISEVAGIDALGGTDGYKGLTLHFENLLPSDASITDRNSNLNSITFSDKTLSDFGASSVEALNAQIGAGDNPFFMVGQTVDDFGTHGYLYIA